MESKPNITPSLLWEYDLTSFDWQRSYKIVIERVVQLGSLEDWREMVSFYKPAKIEETLNWSRQLDQRDKDFARLFLKSDLLHAV